MKLTTYEDFYSSEKGQWYSYESFEGSQYIAFLVYKYFLNFPLSFFVWFNNSLLHLTTYFFIPNAITIGLLLKYFLKKRKGKELIR